MSQMSQALYPITRGNNPLFVLDIDNKKHVLAVGNPHGEELKNTFSAEPLTNKREKKLFQEENLGQIDPSDFYGGRITRLKIKRRRTIRKTNKRRRARVSKKQRTRRSKKSKYSKAHNK